MAGGTVAEPAVEPSVPNPKRRRKCGAMVSIGGTGVMAMHYGEMTIGVMTHGTGGPPAAKPSVADAMH